MTNPIKDLTFEQRQSVLMTEYILDFIVGMERMQKSQSDGGGPTQSLLDVKAFVTTQGNFHEYAPAVEAFMDAIQKVIDSDLRTF